MELKKYKLGELIDVTRGQSLSGEYYATEGKYIRLTCGNFDYNNNCFKENTSKDNLFFTGTIKPEFIMEKGDIITPLTEQAIGLLGSTAIIPESDKYIQSQDVAKIICKEDKLDHGFAYYLISSKLVKEQLSVAAQQTKIRHTSPDKIKDCTVWIPDMENQRRIAHVLSTLDRKISLNRSINEELERMAKEIYDYWFVQFDFPDEHGRPYKSSGGAMVYNPVLKREVPEGWEVKTIGDEALIRRGSVITEKEALAGNVKVVAAGINYSYMHNQSNRKANVITISTSGANAGYMNFWREPIYASDCMTIECDNDVNTLICYYNLWHFREIMLRSACGSAQPHVYPYHIEPLPFIKATNSIIKKFEDVVIPINKDIAKNEKEIEELTALRDELLPLLMTGQVKIK